MMQLMVKDVHAWWDDLKQKQIEKRYPGIMFREPALQPWGLTILFINDPSGVLWHIAQDPNV